MDSSPVPRTAFNLLGLPDEALLHIFSALACGAVDGNTRSDRWRSIDAVNLSSCSLRLNTVYRLAITGLRLGNSYDQAVCSRIWQRFPHIVTLKILLPGCWKFRRMFGSPADYPISMARIGIRSLTLQSGCIYLRYLRAFVEGCGELENFSLDWCEIFFEPDDLEDEDALCAISLEKHAKTLQKLEVCCTTFSHFLSRNPQSDSSPRVDAQWFSLSNFFTLKEFRLTSWHLMRLPSLGGFFGEGVRLPGLQILHLCDLMAGDEVLEAILPSVPQLRCLTLKACQTLTKRILTKLPSQLDYLDITDTELLDYTETDEPAECTSPGANFSEGKGTVTYLVAGLIWSPRFEHFLEHSNGASIEKLVLRESSLRTSADLVYLLSRAPNLLFLDLDGVQHLDVSVFGSIARLARLRDLRASDTDACDECVSLIASGACRHSLIFLDLSRCEFIEDLVGTRRLFSSSVPGCVVFWPEGDEDFEDSARSPPRFNVM